MKQLITSSLDPKAMKKAELIKLNQTALDFDRVSGLERVYHLQGCLYQGK